ncbi:MAG: rhodanese-like domain-containing protein [Desulfosarcinaceae bacterium]|nr:rhodanese-like domain-containing protein [Desulfosarcinaceae bacterium]
MQTTIRALLLIGLMASLPEPVSTLAASSGEEMAKLEAVYAMYQEYKQAFPSVDDIAPDEAAALFGEGRLQFVDVREPEEIAVSSLPGSIDKDTYLKNPRGYQDQTVVVFCTISYRSGVLAQELARQGVRVRNLKGGILAWVLEGGKVFDREEETKRLHVYGPKWDLAPADFDTLTFGWWERLGQ